MTHEAIIEKAQAYIAGLFAGDSTGHDEQHSLRVWRNALLIADEAGGDRFVIQLAALLHDADDAKLFPESAGGLLHARAFLQECGVPQDTAEHVCACIRTVGFKGGHNAPPATLEAEIVQDADRLDAIGAIGIARTFAYGGAKHRAIYTPGEEPQHYSSSEAYASSTGSSISHFYEKLLLLRGLMHTPAARRIADQRHAYMEAFLTQFLAEWHGER